MLGFCFYSKNSLKETKRLGLSALLHDVGKTEIPDTILKAPRKLSSKEFSIMKRHPKIGEFIIKVKSGIDGGIADGATERDSTVRSMNSTARRNPGIKLLNLRRIHIPKRSLLGRLCER